MAHLIKIGDLNFGSKLDLALVGLDLAKNDL